MSRFTERFDFQDLANVAELLLALEQKDAALKVYDLRNKYDSIYVRAMKSHRLEIRELDMKLKAEVEQIIGFAL